jgi:Leucine-rich repeat (LRR) protein
MVSKNSLSGDVPEGLWALPNVYFIDLADNQFTYGIGSGIGNAMSLNNLVVARNRFSGAIPLSIGNAVSLATVDLSSNEFSGKIPESIGNLSRLSKLNLLGNQISGAVPLYSTFQEPGHHLGLGPALPRGSMN